MRWRLTVCMDDNIDITVCIDDKKAVDADTARWRYRKKNFRHPWWWHVERIIAEPLP